MHNLTELRQKLEESKVLKINARNRPHDEQAEDWPEFPDTPSEDSDYDAEEWRESRKEAMKNKKEQSEEEDSWSEENSDPNNHATSSRPTD